MKKLFIDTSTQILILILEVDEKIKDYIVELVERDHSSKLMPCIEMLLRNNQIDIKEINEIIVTEGPGSYTGVRIGVTVAKTLSYALNIPLKTISSLELISASYINQAKYIVPLIDARRGNVFSGLYEVRNCNLNPIFESQLYSFSDLMLKIKEKIKESIHIVGIDSHKFTIDDSQFQFHTAFVDDFSPLSVMRLNFQTVKNVHTFVPNYKRLSEAEMNLK